MMKHALIIFVKNMVCGKVKTRLAATVGHEKAIEIYKELLHYTNSVTQQLDCDKIVFYSDEILQNDNWSNVSEKQVQQGFDLGERMLNAFAYCFTKSCQKVIIIGTDCPELTTKILHNAFDQLENYDVIIGPAADGGYYLLGMKQVHEHLFNNMAWSTKNVLRETIHRCGKNNLTHALLPTLHDVDNEYDLPYLKAILP